MRQESRSHSQTPPTFPQIRSSASAPSQMLLTTPPPETSTQWGESFKGRVLPGESLRSEAQHWKVMEGNFSDREQSSEDKDEGLTKELPLYH